jgi:hypothetical protein
MFRQIQKRELPINFSFTGIGEGGKSHAQHASTITKSQCCASVQAPGHVIESSILNDRPSISWSDRPPTPSQVSMQAHTQQTHPPPAPPTTSSPQSTRTPHESNSLFPTDAPPLPRRALQQAAKVTNTNRATPTPTTAC